ncbi:phage protein [Vibrio sp. Vb2853]|uniref:phage protein n=1 Tax=Vibrio TaxID=662 RepID=UPI00102DBEEB|nr:MULTISPECIES: phage protein [Vibrio]MDW1615058.1 phage protein [Vibrio sp. Vb2881]MDW1619774.1 phage protein [Vibrio sp. Vb2864]MDW1691908.1 phage protein [Vibrio sp. Vb2853]MDW1710618.1 phage protein [Vibrio sp. Vb2865]MDW1715739.1 phage protein [Vibrio sp. Vb2873]
MGKRISGMSFDVDIHDTLVHVEKATVTITDDSQATKTRGVPDDFTDGAVGAEVEYELDTKNFKLLGEAAKAAGSWRGIEAHDSLFYANTGSEELEIKVFGVKLMIDSLLDIDSSSADKSVHKIKGIVTSPDFIHIDGVPYLSSDDTRDLIG